MGDFDKGPYPESDTQTRGKGQNFFSEKFSNLRTPHALYIAGLSRSEISGASAWKNFKQLAKESMGTHSEEYYGLPPVYLKLTPKILKILFSTSTQPSKVRVILGTGKLALKHF